MKKTIKAPKKLGLVLGGGAMKGAAIFGIMEELNKLDLHFTHVAGTSVGAIIGSFYALHGEIWSFKEELKGFTKKDWLKFVDMNHLFGRSLIKAKYYRSYLEKRFGDATFNDTRIPLIISATNLSTGQPEYLKTGKLVDAIMASSAYPGIFPPVENKQGLFVDGCVLDNLPYELLLEQGVPKIVAVNLSGYIKNTKFNSAFDIIWTSIELMMENALKGKEINHDRLFMFTPKLQQSPISTWNINDLHEKFLAGKREFRAKRTKFIKWLQN